MRLLIPIFLIIISIIGFMYFVEPIYKDVLEARTLLSSYETGLARLTSLLNEKDKLITKEHSINDYNQDRINKLLPANIDNIRLIIEIQEIASIYGMTVKDIKFDEAKNMKEEVQPEAGVKQVAKNDDYGTLNFYFSVEGSYNNFLNFTRDLENNLRIIDISSIQFTSADLNPLKSSSEYYKYGYKIKTYWLKK